MLFGFAEVAEDGAEIWGNLAGSYDCSQQAYCYSWYLTSCVHLASQQWELSRER